MWDNLKYISKWEITNTGDDGYTAEFYKQFFSLLGEDLVSSFNAAFDIDEMSVSQQRGVITLLPKEESILLLLSNSRLIRLLNTDYKIASKVIAKRKERVLPSVIHPDQTGFMKGRYIGQNIRLTYHRFRWYATFENKTPTETFPKFLLVLRVNVIFIYM